MRLGGWQKISLIDYPGKISSVLFTTGCNFKCSYCHNPELVQAEQFPDSIAAEEIFTFLEKRRGQLDAVVITGGEPTLHQDLPQFIERIKLLGYLVKLDSNGTNPAMLDALIQNKSLDYIAMDIKAPLDKYESIVRMPVDIEAIKKSIALLKKSSVDYEFRTTVIKTQLTPEDFGDIAELIHGARLYAFQKFIPTKANDEKVLSEPTYSDREFKDLQKIMAPHVGKVIIR